MRDQLDDNAANTSEAVGEASKLVRLVAVDAYITDLSPVDVTQSRPGNRLFYSPDMTAVELGTFLNAKPNCFVLTPLAPKANAVAQRRYRAEHSVTARLIDAAKQLRGGSSSRPSSTVAGDVAMTSPGQDNADDDGVLDSEAEIRSKPAVPMRTLLSSGAKRPPLSKSDSIRKFDEPSGSKQACFSLTMVLPDDPADKDSPDRTRRQQRQTEYEELQLAAWRDGNAPIPMPSRDPAPLDTKYGFRMNLHLTQVGFVHLKRFEDELKATIDVVKVSCEAFWHRCVCHRCVAVCVCAERGKAV